MLKIFENKPWKAWTTRKFSFMYCLIFGTVLIIVSFIALFLGYDASAILDIAISFVEWVVISGAAITIVKAVRKNDSEDE